MKSMTGYGTGKVKWKSKNITLEIKTVNHRFCEINLRLPNRLYPYETDLSEFAKKKIHRGRVDIFIRENGTNGRGRVQINEDQLHQYLQICKKLKQKFKQTEPLRLESLFSLPQVILIREEEENLKELLEILKEELSRVFKKVEAMREKEGKWLKEDFLKRLELLEDRSLKIAEKVPQILSDYHTRLKERIKKLTEQAIDEWKLAQEVAYFADRSDISEELDRLKNHLKHFREILEEKNPIGRKLDFILQEMNREVNTLGSKAQDSAVSKWIVDCKHELEKLREQVQNVE